MSQINDVKVKLKEKLDTLNPSFLKYVEITDIKRDPLDAEINTYPACFIQPPAIATVSRLDNRNVVRELTFTIMVVLKADDLPSASATEYVEGIMEAMMNVLDNSITLDNTAQGGLFPTSSFPEPFVHNGKSYLVFDIIVKTKVVQLLTFS